MATTAVLAPSGAAGGRARPGSAWRGWTRTSTARWTIGRQKGSLLSSRAGAGSRTSRSAATATPTPGWRWSTTRSGDLLDDKPITSGGRDDALREGALRCSIRWRSSSPPSPTFASTARGCRGARSRPGVRADARVAPAHPHRRAHLRFQFAHPVDDGLPPRPASCSTRHAVRPRRGLRRVGEPSAPVRAGASGTTRSPPTCGPDRRARLRPGARRVLRQRISTRIV